MATRIVGITVITAIAAGIAGCGSTPKVVRPPPALIEAPGRAALTVGAADSGAPVVLQAGQELQVRLATMTVAGSAWSLVDFKPGALTAQGPVFERAPRSINVEESSGFTVWRFRAEAPGSAALRFEWRALRRLDPATEVVTYAVTVR